jgi:hypothetical protein
MDFEVDDRFQEMKSRVTKKIERIREQIEADKSWSNERISSCELTRIGLKAQFPKSTCKGIIHVAAQAIEERRRINDRAKLVSSLDTRI